jgi:CO dehydrogenase maturation factor
MFNSLYFTKHNFELTTKSLAEGKTLSYLIAMAGKGGTGKTTVAGLAVRYLMEHGKKPVLAVDADANSNFNEVLGVTVGATVGQAREEVKKGGGMVDMTKDQLVEFRINQCLVEATGYDLICMGQPEGSGCYCAANHLITHYMDVLSKNYPYIVMDNEAGLEHLSRLTTKDVDLLLIVSDPSFRGVQAARRVYEVAKSLKIVMGEAALIINRLTNGIPPRSQEEIDNWGLPLAGTIPEDPLIAEYDGLGKPTVNLPADSIAVKAVNEIFSRLVK